MAHQHRLSHIDQSPVHEFLEFISKRRQQGIHFGPSPRSSSFIPDDELRHYLLSSGRLESLLECVCKKRFPQKSLNAIYDRLRIFSVLLMIEKGSLIEYCLKIRNLADDWLPIENPPPGFTAETFKHFYEHQWEFCAHSFRDSDSDLKIPDDAVIPIIDREDKGTGRTATISRVKIHPYYCFCAIEEGSDEDSDRNECVHEFIIKVYNSSDPLAGQSYRNELRAFETLALNEDVKNYIVKFYGSFVQQDTHVIILEYADQGTLEEFYEKENPKQENDITKFWGHLFNLARGLAQIHDEDHHGTFHGVHQDIKPSNILVFSNGASSLYDYTFKIADLGHSHFAESEVTGEDDVDDDAAATVPVGARTYGPPDHYLGRLVNHKVIKVHRKGDVWSMACIFSEAAGWVVYGPTAIPDFRKRRMDAVRNTAGFADGDCFHNGNDVLPAIKEWHAHLAGMRRAGDRVTPNIWHELLQDAFRPYEQRLDAVQLIGKAEDLLNTQKRGAVEDFHDVRGNDRGLDFSPTQPRRARTHDASTTAGNVTHHGHGSLGASSSAPTPIKTFRESNPTDSISVSPSTPRTGTNSHRTSSGTTGTQPSRLSPSYSHNHVVDSSESPTRHSKRLSSNSSNNAGDIKRLVTAEALEELKHLSGSPKNYVFNYTAAEQSFENRMLRPDMQSSPTQAQCRLHSAQQSSVPEISLEEALKWKERRKSLSGSAKDQIRLKYHDHVDEAKGRDQIFLIDDTISMGPYWQEVATLFRTLSYLTKTVDDDGVIQLRFTVSPYSLRTKRSSTLASKVDERGAQLNIHSNPETACYRILREWKAAMSRSRVFGRKDPDMSPVTLYIFTDGVWQEESNLINFVQDVVTFMERYDMAPKHIGIQFVQFGYDKVGSARLEQLDSELGLTRDIVDSEPSDGNLLKILLGSINPTFDKHRTASEGLQCTCPQLPIR